MATQGRELSDPCAAMRYIHFSFLFSSFVLYFYCVYFAYLLFDMCIKLKECTFGITYTLIYHLFYLYIS